MGFPLTRFYNKEESIKYCFILVFTNLQDGKKKKKSDLLVFISWQWCLSIIMKNNAVKAKLFKQDFFFFPLIQRKDDAY